MNGIKHINMNKIEIPFGAYDSETLGWTYTIPKGYTAKIEDEKIVVKKEELEDEKIKKSLVKFLKSLPIKHRCEYAASELENWLAWLEKQKEQKAVEPSDDELQRHQDELYDFKVFAAKQAKEHHISFVHDFEWNNFCAELLSYFNERQKPADYNEYKMLMEGAREHGKTEGRKEVIDHPEEYGLTKQKPVGWSEEDESQLDDIEKAISNYFDLNHAPQYHYWLEQKLKSLRLQPKQEWSEEEQQIISFAADWLTRMLERTDVPEAKRDIESVILGLKSLRPQKKIYDGPWRSFTEKKDAAEEYAIQAARYPVKESEYLADLEDAFISGVEWKEKRWKPSEEQMCYLKKVYESYDFCDGERDALESLYNDLKKLM